MVADGIKEEFVFNSLPGFWSGCVALIGFGCRCDSGLADPFHNLLGDRVIDNQFEVMPFYGNLSKAALKEGVVGVEGNGEVKLALWFVDL
jgi:hypothetical protein